MNEFRDELLALIKKYHESLNYWQMLAVLINAVRDVFEKSSAEYVVKGGQ